MTLTGVDVDKLRTLQSIDRSLKKIVQELTLIRKYKERELVDNNGND